MGIARCTDAKLPNDDAAVNQGQLKQFTQKAVQELDARIPDGAGAELNALSTAGCKYTRPVVTTRPIHSPADFDAMNSGQLKWIASKVHARLVFAKYEEAPPAWLVQNAATDKQLVNSASSKPSLTSTSPPPPPNLPVWWQKFYFNGQTGIDPNGDDDSDGLINTDEITNGTSPVNPDTDGDFLTELI